MMVGENVMTNRSRIVTLSFLILILVSMACNLEDITGDDSLNIETAVAASLEAIAASLTNEPAAFTEFPNPTAETP
jgi:hypothetical protein